MISTSILLPAATALLAAAPASQQTAASAGQANGPLLNQVPGPYGFVRCATPPIDPVLARSLPPSDCSANSTNPTAAYSPANLEVVQIKVVFHVIRQSNGSGNVPNSRILSQLDILNEDFSALSGTPGANGTDTGIEFVLATEDPQGNPSPGILRYDNSTWYNDGGSYWNTIAWDPAEYMNVYTMGAPAGSSGVLGYVPFLPQTGGSGVGAARDRVVVLNTAVGRNAPLAPYNQGRTLVHEVGHYLGLEHTFSGGCGGGNCYTSGDLICDTNSDSQPEYGCAVNSSSCGSTDPVRNYMNYSTDVCMQLFTEEQSRRMRCTLEFWRDGLAEPIGPVLGENYCGPGVPNSTGQPGALTATGSKQLSANNVTISAQNLPANSTGFFVVSSSQAFVQGPGGSQGNLCLGGSVGRYLSQIGNTGIFGILSLSVDVNAIPQPNGLVAIQPGETWNFQCWHRDANPNATSNFTDAYTITFQ